MSRFRLHLALFLLLFCGKVELIAQPVSLPFDHITIEDGLPSDDVGKVLQDQLGFIWIATLHGLVKYDGYDFKVYAYDPFDPGSISDSSVGGLFEDHEGSLWIGTWSAGVNRYDRVTDSFTRFQHDSTDPQSLSSNDGPFRIIEDSENVLWIGTRNGLNRLDSETGTFIRYNHDPEDPSSLRHDTVSELYEPPSKPGILLVGTPAGLDLYDRATNSFSRFRTNSPDSDPWSDRVAALLEDRQGILWASVGSGLNRYNPATGEFKRYEHNPDDSHSLPGSVGSLFEDSHGQFWIGIFGALVRFDRNTETFITYSYDPDDPNSLSYSLQPVGLFEDREGTLWISSAGGGLSLLRRSSATIAHYRRNPSDSDSPKFNPGVFVMTLLDDEEGNLWTGTFGEGLYHLDRKTNRFTRYLPDSETTETYGNRIWSIYRSPGDTRYLWVGTWSHGGRGRGYGGGLHRFDRIMGTFTYYPTSETNGGYTVVGICEDEQGRLWLATWHGLYRFDPDIESFEGYFHVPGDSNSLSGDLVRDVLVDRSGTIWIATDKGLDRLDPKTGTFTNFSHDEEDLASISSNEIKSLYEDRQGRLWIGTDAGLNRYDPDTASFIRYARFDGGLINVFRMAEDDKGRLWITHFAAEGVTRFDPETEIFKHFDHEDGFRFGSSYGVYASSRGELFVGGTNGIDVFYPEQLEDDPVAPLVSLTGFRLYGEPVVPEADGPLKQPIHEARQIQLSHQQNDLTFEYVGLHFKAPERNRYNYMLEGFDSDWRGETIERRATYTNLPPGDYVFRVKASNADGVWNEQGASIRVKIFPPWWRTLFAFVVYGLLLVAGLVTVERIHRKRLIRVERERARERELEKTREIEAMNRRLLEHERQLERQNEQLEAQKDQLETQARQLLELDSAKSRFFANISHEFRTPLTLILGPIESALRGPVVEPVKALLRGIHDQAQRLLRLVNQLLDLARIESGKMTLQAWRGDLATCLRDLVRSFTPMAEGKRIMLQFHSESPACPLVFDPDKIEKIFGNLLSNAIKFTPEGGKVRLTINNRSNVSDYVEVTVKDTGPGIAREALDQLFDRFERLNAPATRRQEGTGIGLALAKEFVELHGGEIRVESEEGFGSAFIVRLPADLQENPEKSKRDIEPFQETGSAAVELELIDSMPAGLEKESPVEAVPFEVQRASLLLVDDNEEVRAFVRTQLESTYDVIEAADGEEALEQVWVHRPDLVLSDVMMPGMDGFELCRRLKSDEALRHIPVVLLTARAGESDTVQGLDCGADDYVVKPFNTEELRARLAGLIRSRRALRTQFSREVVVQPSGIVAQPEDEAFLEQVLAIVEAHMDDSMFGVERLADELAISPRQLGRKLRELTKKTPSAFIWEVRLARAAQLLQARAGSVAEVAYRAGFKSPSHFSTAFRKAYGVSPSAFVANSP